MFYTFFNVYCIIQFFLKCFNKTTTQEDVIYTSGLFIMVLTDLEQEPNQKFQEQFPLFKNTIYKEFPGCLVVRTRELSLLLPGFSPGWGTEILQASRWCSKEKKKKKTASGSE